MSEQLLSDSVQRDLTVPSFDRVIDDICGLKWTRLTQEELINVAWVYYYFSVQFRKS